MIFLTDASHPPLSCHATAYKTRFIFLENRNGYYTIRSILVRVKPVSYRDLTITLFSFLVNPLFNFR